MPEFKLYLRADPEMFAYFCSRLRINPIGLLGRYDC